MAHRVISSGSIAAESRSYGAIDEACSDSNDGDMLAVYGHRRVCLPVPPRWVSTCC